MMNVFDIRLAIVPPASGLAGGLVAFVDDNVTAAKATKPSS
jgi:hypothetical protein